MGSRAEPAKMKFLAVLLLVALAYAEPEAAPDAEADAEAAPWYYGYYGHPGYYGGWGGYYGRRWGGYYGWGGYPYSYGYWKRDAEEQQPDQMVKREAEEGDAKPAMLYPDTTDTTQPPSTTELLDTHMPTIPMPSPILL